MIDVEKVLAAATRELDRLQNGEIVLNIGIVPAVRIIGLVQVSLRHPNLPEENKNFGMSFCNNLIELIERASPDLANFCRLGFGAEHDDKPDRYQVLESCRDHWKTAFVHERENVIRLRAEVASQHAIHYEARGGQCDCLDCQLVRSHAGPPA